MVRFATIGTNFITEYLLGASKFCKNFELEAVCSRNEENAKAFAEKWGAKRYFTSVDDIAACPDIDAVYIATPNFTHYGYAMQMLNAGKHVLVEKSGAANEREYRQMVELAKKKGLVVLEAIRIAFNPDLELIRQSLENSGKSAGWCSAAGHILPGMTTIKGHHRKRFSARDVQRRAHGPRGIRRKRHDRPVWRAAEGKRRRRQAGKRAGRRAHRDVHIPRHAGHAVHRKSCGRQRHERNPGEDGLMLIDGCSAPDSVTISYNTRRSGEVKTEKLPILATPFGEDMKYELQAMIDLIENGGAGTEKYNDRTLRSLAVMDEIRAQCGMVFPNDNA